MAQQSPAGKGGPRCPLIPSIAVASVATIEVYVDTKDEAGGSRKLYLGDLSPQATREEIQEQWGGGHFELHAMPQRGTDVLAVVSQSIAGDPRWQDQDPSNAGGFDGPPMDPRGPQQVFAIPADGGVAAGLPPTQTQEIIEKTQARRDERADMHGMLRMVERQSQMQTTMLVELMRSATSVRAPDPGWSQQASVAQQQLQMLTTQIHDLQNRYQNESALWFRERTELMQQQHTMQMENHRLHRELAECQAQMKWMVSTAGNGTPGKDGKPTMVENLVSLAGSPMGQAILAMLMKGGMLPGGAPPPGIPPGVAG